MTYHLAIDIGASSGRHILGYIENGKICLEEIYRFEDYLREENGSLVWDIQKLVREVKAGIAKCGENGKIPATIAVDTWGVDYVLLDENKQELTPAFSYRDKRNNLIQPEVAEIITHEEMYERTGIQKSDFNTVYQLYCDKKSGKLNKAKYFLMMPDYIAFKLTGLIRNEYTDATTTNLVNAETNSWDDEILDRLGIRKDIFSEISLPCTSVGSLKGFDFSSEVVLAPSHDTASAVAACSAGNDGVYISSGTWSLIGIENPHPVISNEALKANFTNEGGIEYRFRFLKNIIGMWLFQNIRKELDKKYTYDEMMEMAEKCGEFEIIDTNDSSFVAPPSMIDAIRKYLKKDDLPIPVLINSVYHSLAKSYAKAVSEIETISNRKMETINIVGGGSRDGYLNRLTARYTGKKVTAGPVEATATGNIISQMIYSEELASLEEARKLIRKSFSTQEVE
ncbi:MAG: rhamnulokinase [Clostridiales bacterium]|nr:rhamnulokinase [Clostridiales bacterium]